MAIINDATIKMRRGTAAEWIAENPTPKDGEHCQETDTGNTKVGDGLTAWNDLGYSSIPFSAGIASWDDTNTYNTAGELVTAEGLTFSATGEALNQDKSPLNPNNGLFWYMPDDENDLLRDANRGTVRRGAMHTVHDRSSGNYAQNLQIGKKKVDSVQQEFHFIHLDGTVVTGNTTLENLMDVGGGNEYIYLDLYAPDNLGTRTLLDMGDYVPTPQSSGGDADTVGDLVEDQFQGHRHSFDWTNNGNGANAANNVLRPGIDNDTLVLDPIADGTNGTPRTGLRTHGKRFTEGAAYFVVMQAA